MTNKKCVHPVYVSDLQKVSKFEVVSNFEKVDENIVAKHLLLLLDGDRDLLDADRDLDFLLPLDLPESESDPELFPPFLESPLSESLPEE